MAVVTVSRMPASLGDEVARSVASTLGYRFVGRAELVALAGQLEGTGQWDRAPEMRERSPSFWERLNEERRRSVGVLRHAVLHLAAEGDVVIVGLGAGQFLRGLRHALRTQIVAPVPVRLERLMQTGTDEQPGPLSREKAREILRQVDRDGHGYVRYMFNIDWMDPSHWDLVLNTGRYSVQEAATVITGVVRSGLLDPTEDDRLQLRDLELASTVESALLNSAQVWVSGLKVNAASGRISLEGEVIGEEDREVAEQLVREIPGVRAVDNDLRIQPPPLTGM